MFEAVKSSIGSSLRSGEELVIVLEIHDVMSFLLYGVHFLIIPLGRSFPLHCSAMKQPPYGTFGKGHYYAPRQAGVRGEPGHWKCADTSLLGTVKGLAVLGGSGRGINVCKRNAPFSFYGNRCSRPCFSSLTLS